jgi:hypothetical protein
MNWGAQRRQWRTGKRKKRHDRPPVRTVVWIHISMEVLKVEVLDAGAGSLGVVGSGALVLIIVAILSVRRRRGP